tara:strand:+ start:499 stop:1131 length:633 start_codon:yes stop_codon:yes gene_type:complete
MITQKINLWVMKNSTDPTGAYLTEAIKARRSMQDFMANWSAVKQEIISNKELNEPISGDPFFPEEITNDGKWFKTYIHWYGKWYSDSHRFPILCSLVRKHPDIKLAMVSVLKPKAVILPHYGPWAGGIRVHIGVSTPNSNDCYIDIEGHRYSWRDDELVAFSDIYEHQVKNNTDTPRVILFMDLERTMKSKFSQFVVRLINQTLAKWNRA